MKLLPAVKRFAFSVAGGGFLYHLALWMLRSDVKLFGIF